ncbi:MAG: hypothetical protein JW963_11670 [Anaerolineales bacterium]|nr:hypothetical protein [Anaerolineales bacterium]
MKYPTFGVVSVILLNSIMAACQPVAQVPLSTVSPAPSATPADGWFALLGHAPVPWTTSLPAQQATILDSTYVKINPRLATPFPCKRCPDYALEGGLWKFQLDKGVFRIYYTVNGWRSLGSYTVSGDVLYLFNDPYCNWDTGSYSWTLDGGVLTLTEIDDPCSQGLRAANLTDQPWLSCQPPNVEAMVTDHWQKPQGCEPSEN